MEDRDWDSIDINKILLMDNLDIVFISCKTQEDANMFTLRAKNIPPNGEPNAPRLVMYVDRRAAKRHKAIANIAKSLREQAKNSIQTTIRVGKNDYLLRKRDKGSSTPWADIPPLKLNQELPDFEVGTYTNILETVENLNKPNEIEDNEDNQIENLDEIIRDISSQNTDKRERSNDKHDIQTVKQKRNNTSPMETPEQSGAEESEGESSQKELLNSTPIQPNNTVDGQRILSLSLN